LNKDLEENVELTPDLCYPVTPILLQLQQRVGTGLYQRRN